MFLQMLQTLLTLPTWNQDFTRLLSLSLPPPPLPGLLHLAPPPPLLPQWTTQDLTRTSLLQTRVQACIILLFLPPRPRPLPLLQAQPPPTRSLISKAPFLLNVYWKYTPCFTSPPLPPPLPPLLLETPFSHARLAGSCTARIRLFEGTNVDSTRTA
jgi:hypothetical protein